jgi:choline kinase
LNIVVPLAGKDDSFVERFGDLKPFVDVNGTSLIELTLKCLPFENSRLVFICLAEENKKYDAESRLKNIFGNDISVLVTERQTDGSLCSALLAADLIDSEEDLLIDLADVYFDPLSLKEDIENKDPSIKGIIPICGNTVQNKPWGYTYLNAENLVERVSEKELDPSCKNATLGLYYFSHGKDFVKYAKDMIKRNLRVPYNNLFYVAPLYNLFLDNKEKVGIAYTKILNLLGTPDEVKEFLESCQCLS